MKNETIQRGEREVETGDEVNSIWISSSLRSSWITVISFSPPRCVETEKSRDGGEKKHSPPPTPPFAMCVTRVCQTQGRRGRLCTIVCASVRKTVMFLSLECAQRSITVKGMCVLCVHIDKGWHRDWCEASVARFSKQYGRAGRERHLLPSKCKASKLFTF